MIEVIRTERLELRPLVADDAEALEELLDDPLVNEWLGPELADLRERFRRWERRRSPDGSKEWLNWTVRQLGVGAPVGWVQATVSGPAAEVAYATLPSQRRRGYTAEAAAGVAGWLDVPSVEAHVAASNDGSAGVARALGLRPTPELHDGEVVWRRP